MSRKEINDGVAVGPVLYPAKPTQDFWEQSITQKYQLGARLVLEDSRVFRYAKVGAAALVAADVISSPAFGGSVANVQNDLAVQAGAAIGATVVYLTTGTDAVTKDQFRGGYLSVSDGGIGIGEGLALYRIMANAAGAAGTIRFELDRPLTIAWTTSTVVTIMTNPYKLVIQAPVTTPVGMVVGVACLAVDVNYFTWLQTWGLANVLNKTAAVIGDNLILDLGAAGSLGASGGSEAQSVLGISPMVTDTTDCGPVFLQISP
jgi:hypothetical protein